MSQTTLCWNFGGKEWGGGATFKGGVLAGHYGILGHQTMAAQP